MNLEETHRKAIEIAETAFIKKSRGSTEEAIELFKEALSYEIQAAYMALDGQIGEPSQSILLKGAASLAINAKEYRQAEKLLGLALHGDPPDDIADEIRMLLEEVNFNHHLQLRGIELNSAELQMVIVGNGVGPGKAKANEVIHRVHTMDSLAIRTAERITGRPFRKTGKPAKMVEINTEPYMTVGRAASYAFTIQFGGEISQTQLDGFQPSIKVIDDVIENINLINKDDYVTLRRNISDESYFQNFISLTKELAPDGDDVKMVGLTITRKGETSSVQLRRIRKEIKLPRVLVPQLITTPISDFITLKGVLQDAFGKKGEISLQSDKKYTIKVPDGLIDIVKNYFMERVKVQGYLLNEKTIQLYDLEKDEEA